jgi:hypothetical protein
MTEKTAFPLCWPDGRPRTASFYRRHARFKTSFASARSNLIREIKLLGGDGMICSSDIPRRQDGLPYAYAKPKSGDPGIACYFKRKGKQLCFACDCYLTVDDNMQAIALTIQALRGIARWGTGDMMEAAFRGFAALPEKSSSSWWEVLGISINATKEQAQFAYRALAKQHHPDVGGDSEKFRRINEAWKQCESQ